MKHLLWILTLCVSAVFCCAQTENTEQPKRIKTGFYVGDGSQGSGVLYLARILHYSPQLEVTLLDGQDLRDGKLSSLDFLLIPGGSSTRQYQSMQEEGAEAVRKFVREGGAYYGVCAGFHCTLNKPTRIRLMPYEHIPRSYGGVADVTIELSQEGADLIGVPAGRHTVRYAKAPIVSNEQKTVGETFAKTLAVYTGSIYPKGLKGKDMTGTPAFIWGAYGKGKVIATGFHPEYREDTVPFALGCINAVTGVKPTPIYPSKNLRPVRVAFDVHGISGKNHVLQMLELDRHPDIYVAFVSEQAYQNDALGAADILIFPDGTVEKYKAALPPHEARYKAFMDSGKIILASENSLPFLPKHKNLKSFKTGDPLVPQVLAVK